MMTKTSSTKAKLQMTHILPYQIGAANLPSKIRMSLNITTSQHQKRQYTGISLQVARNCICRQHLQQKIINGTMTKFLRDGAHDVYHQP